MRNSDIIDYRWSQEWPRFYRWIDFLNGIGVIVLLEHSHHLLQIFDMVVAAPLKRAFTFELDQRISWFTDANPGERDKTQIIR
jgi:hypothetical protein